MNINANINLNIIILNNYHEFSIKKDKKTNQNNKK